MSSVHVSGASYFKIIFRRIQKNRKLRAFYIGLILYTIFEIGYSYIPIDSLSRKSFVIETTQQQTPSPASAPHFISTISEKHTNDFNRHLIAGLKGALEALKWIIRSFIISILISVINDAIKDLNAEHITKFQGLFRIKSHQLNKVAIVIPYFDRDYFVRYLTDKKYAITEPEGLSQDEKDLVAKKKFASWSDLIAARIISGLFQKVIKKMPDIITDQKALELIKEKSDRYSNYILIGLHSNKVVKEIIFTRDAQGELTHKEKIERQIRFAPGTRGNEASRDMLVRISGANHLTSQEMTKTDLDITVFSVFDWSIDGLKLNFSVIGGLNATGTEVMAKMIFEQWERFADTQVVSRSHTGTEKRHPAAYQMTTAYTKVFRVKKRDSAEPCSGYDPENAIISYEKDCLL